MTLKALIVTGLAAASITVAAQEKMVMVGGESMLPSKNIVANAVNSKDHTTLVAALISAGSVEASRAGGRPGLHSTNWPPFNQQETP